MTEIQASQTEFLGVAFDRLDEVAAVDVCLRLASGQRFAYVVTPNVDHIVRLQATATPSAAELWRAYGGASLRLCDSRIIQLLARWSGVDLMVVPGSDLTARILHDTRLGGLRLALVGGDADALAWLVRVRPDAAFVQTIPPMGAATNAAAQAVIIKFVEDADADVVLFTIGSPQSELLCQRIADRGAAHGVGLCIGASIEFLIGAKRRAPRLVRRLRLEWAFRLASEPRRLWRRYLIEGPRIFAIWREWTLRQRR